MFAQTILHALTTFLCAVPSFWPPMPDFDHPVDYLAWYESLIRGDNTPVENAFPALLALDDRFDPINDNLSHHAPSPCRFPAQDGAFWDEPEPIRPWSGEQCRQWQVAWETNEPYIPRLETALAKPYRLPPRDCRVGDRCDPPMGSLAWQLGFIDQRVMSQFIFILHQRAWCREGTTVDPHRFLAATHAVLSSLRQTERSSCRLALARVWRTRAAVADSLLNALSYGFLGAADQSRLLQIVRPHLCAQSQWPKAAAICFAELAERLQLAHRQCRGLGESESTLIPRGVSEAQLIGIASSYYLDCARLLDLPLTPVKLRALRTLGDRCAGEFLSEEIFLSDLGRGAFASASALSQLAGAQIVIAAHVYLRREAHWPASLDDLVTAGLIDSAIDPLNGNRFGYRVVDGQPLIYSFGVDGIDDGGRHRDDFGWTDGIIASGDFVVWPLDRRIGHD